MVFHSQRQQLIKLAHELAQDQALDPSEGRSGNISLRLEDHFLITPTGIANADLQIEQGVLMSLEGEVLADQLKPSSEWRFHRDLYVAREDLKAIIHTHSTYATALACHRKELPAFHYMIAEFSGDSIRCADYATFGTQQLSDHIVQAMMDRKACLIANHGMLVAAADLDEALQLAKQLEELCKQYLIALQLGPPSLLSASEMARNIEKFKHYGKQHNDD